MPGTPPTVTGKGAPVVSDAPIEPLTAPNASAMACSGGRLLFCSGPPARAMTPSGPVKSVCPPLVCVS